MLQNHSHYFLTTLGQMFIKISRLITRVLFFFVAEKVTGICMPMIIPNVVHGGNYFSVPMCQLLGYLLLASVSSSLANLASIAVER